MTDPLGDGVYVSRDGTEDRFEVGSALYYIINLVIMTYGVCYFLYQIALQNADIPHTFTHAGVNGELYSERFASPFHYALMFTSGRCWVFISVCMMILFRKTRLGCGPRKYGVCTVFWSMALAVLIVMDVSALVIFGSYLASCNGPHSKSNPANDARWCAAAVVWNNPANECSNTGPWTGVNAAITLPDLSVNVDFLWLFGASILFSAMELVFLILPLALWLRSNTVTAATAAVTTKTAVVRDDDAIDPSLMKEDVGGDIIELKKKRTLGRRIGARRHYKQ